MLPILAQAVESSCTINGRACTAGEGKTLLGVFLIVPILFLICFVFWVISLIHVLKHEDVPNRTLWIILHFIGLGVLAGPIYFFAVKRPYDQAHQGGTSGLPGSPPSAPVVDQPADPKPPVDSPTDAGPTKS